MSVLTQLTVPGEARPLKIAPEAIYSSSYRLFLPCFLWLFFPLSFFSGFLPWFVLSFYVISFDDVVEHRLYYSLACFVLVPITCQRTVTFDSLSVLGVGCLASFSFESEILLYLYCWMIYICIFLVKVIKKQKVISFYFNYFNIQNISTYNVLYPVIYHQVIRQVCGAGQPEMGGSFQSVLRDTRLCWTGHGWRSKCDICSIRSWKLPGESLGESCIIHDINESLFKVWKYYYISIIDIGIA